MVDLETGVSGCKNFHIYIYILHSVERPERAADHSPPSSNAVMEE